MRVDAVRLLHKDVLPDLDCCHGMERVEFRPIGNQHHIRQFDDSL
jgi:hypothetical protein